MSLLKVFQSASSSFSERPYVQRSDVGRDRREVLGVQYPGDFQNICYNVRREQAFRYRFYPTPEQETLLRRTMGCARLVYNRALAARTQAWYERQEKVDYIKTSSMLTAWKKQEDLQFLNEVSSVALQQG